MALTEEERKEKQRQYLANFWIQDPVVNDERDGSKSTGEGSGVGRENTMREEDGSNFGVSSSTDNDGRGDVNAPAVVRAVAAEEIPRAPWPGIVYLEEEKIQYDIFANQEEASTRDVRVVSLAKFQTKKRATGRKIAANDSLLTYAVQQLIRVFQRSNNARALLKGHAAEIVDLEITSLEHISQSTHVVGSCAEDGSVFLWWLELSEGKMEEDYEKETIQQRQSAEFAHPVKGIHYKKIRFCPFISAQEQKRLWFALVDGKTRTIRILQRADASPQVGASGSLFDESFLLTGESRGAVMDVCWLVGKRLASSCADGSVTIWDVSTGSALNHFSGRDLAGEMIGLTTSPQLLSKPPDLEFGMIAAMDGSGSEVKILSVVGKSAFIQQEITFSGQGGAVMPRMIITTDPIGEFIVMANASQNAIYILHYSTDLQKVDAITEITTTKPVFSICVTRDSKRTVSAGKMEFRDELGIWCLLEERVQTCYVNAADCTPTFPQEAFAAACRKQMSKIDKEIALSEMQAEDATEPPLDSLPPVMDEETAKIDNIVEAETTGPEMLSAEAPLEQTVEQAVKQPTEISAKVPGEAPVEEQTETPAEIAFKAPVEAPAEVPAAVPAAVPVAVPAAVPAAVLPEEATAGALAETPVESLVEAAIETMAPEEASKELKDEKEAKATEEETTTNASKDTKDSTGTTKEKVLPAGLNPASGLESKPVSEHAMETTEKPVEKKNPAGFEMTDKLERAIRKRISVEMADSFRRLEARFAEETRQREIAEKERLERLVTTVAQTIMSKISESVASTTTDSMEALVLETTSGLTKSIETSLNGTWVAGTVGNEYQKCVETAVRENLASILASSFSKTLLHDTFAQQLRGSGLAASFSDASGVMATQVAEAVGNGLSTGISSKLQESLSSMQSSAGEAISAMDNLRNQMAASSSAVGSIARLVPSRNFSAEIDAALASDDVVTAFTVAIDSKDLDLVMRVAKHANSDRTNALSQLSQDTLFTLIEALGSDLSHDTDLKLEWLSDTLLMVEPEDESVRARAEVVLKGSLSSLEEAYQSLNASGERTTAKRARMLKHVVKSLVPQP